jgi:hypothetical protein
MSTRTIATGSAALLIAVGLVLPVAALEVNTTATGGATVSVTGQGTSAASTSSGASGSTGLKAGVTNIVNSIRGTAQIDTSVDADVTTSADVSSTGSATAGSGSSNTASEGSVILFSRGEIEAAMRASDTAEDNASDNAAFNRINLNFAGSPASVSSNADLAAYIATQMKGDADIAEIQASADSVAVTYKEHAKLFGFISSSLNATAIVDGAGTVTVKRPWYSFMFSTSDKAELEATIQDRVNAVLGTNASVAADENGASANADANANASAQAEAALDAAADASAHLTADEQAELVAEIRAAMRAHFAAAAEAEANANASGSVGY